MRRWAWLGASLATLARAVAGGLASALLLLLRSTWRRVLLDAAPWPAPAVLGFWHGDQVALAALPRAWLRGARVLVSRSADGQLGVWWARALGARVARGSSSRAAVSGALALRRSLREGVAIGLALDGPRGPRWVAGPSGARLAAAAACPLIGVVAVPRRALCLGSWDRLAIPWPGTRVVVAWQPLPGDDPAGALRVLWERAAAVARRPRCGARLRLWLGLVVALLGGCDAERSRAIEELKAADSRARLRALRVLAARPDPDLAPRVLPLLLDPVARVRHAALQALGAVGTRGHLDAVLARLRDRDLEVRLAALRLLGASGHPRAVSTLLPLLRDDSAMVRNAAAQALQALGCSPLQQRRAEGEAYFAEQLVRLADPAAQVRAGAARELGRSGRARAAGPLQRRIAAPGESPVVVGAALRALVRVDAGAARSVVAALGRATDPGRRLLAARAAVRLRPVPWELLQATLTDLRAEVRAATLRALARRGRGPGAASEPSAMAPAAPAALGTTLCAAIEGEASSELRLWAAEAAAALRLDCPAQARAVELRARMALAVDAPSAELGRALTAAFDLLARLRPPGTNALLLALLQRAAFVQQWEEEPWVSAERWREGDVDAAVAGLGVSARAVLPRPALPGSAPNKDAVAALGALLERFPLRAAEAREQPLLPPSASSEQLVASRLAWLPLTAETGSWLLQVARFAGDEEVAVAALARLTGTALADAASRGSGPQIARGVPGAGSAESDREPAVDAVALQQAIEAGLAATQPLRRRAAARACARLPPPLGTARALGLLADADAAVREAAAQVLGRLRARSALPALLALLARDSAPALVEALGLLGDRRATGPLLRLLEEDHAAGRMGERWVVVQALGALADQAAAPALERELTHPEWRLRRAAAAALGRCGRRRSAELLTLCTGDYYAEVRAACVAARARLLASPP